MKGETFKGDPYNRICNQALATDERLCMLQDYCGTRYSTGIKQALGMNRYKGMGTS